MKERRIEERQSEDRKQKAAFPINARKASLTVEASFVLPIFLYFTIAFLYLIQIFTVQEKIQSAITKMGLNLSKTAYVFKELPNTEDLAGIDVSIFGREYDLGIDELIDNTASDIVLKQYAGKYLNTAQINKSCIKNGFDGLNFTSSSLFGSGDYIDIIVSYQIKIPIRLITLPEMQMLQRVRLRCWTGYEVAPAYTTKENTDEAVVYVTETGKAYHKSENCTYIKLSIKAVEGIPFNLRNVSGSKYTPCEICCKGEGDNQAVYYITSYGTRYHRSRDCSGLKRSVRAIPISEIGDRTPCKKCYGN